ncbi:MAG: chromosome segregation protein SMC [Ruminococcaceae bacterium]|nr:chromosome segregation protein SMC [Oscillospiraceae bacterium]
MFLKALTMHGFKSFPDKTVISFDRGITAIVGPNGSGKSNISDAVRWVLGEMSPKSLRGSKMEDVIFNGTSKRKPAGYAEVVMTLDNTDRRSHFDADEINVCRRLYRSGESEYYINQKQVRLKDIVDIFLNTGIGREGYSVIGQGRIADVISTKSDERRGIFEEAAGISKLRYQKKDATNKLEKVSDNLTRISDILTEVESRLPSLERQSEKAEKYVVLKKERTELEVSAFAERIALINKEKEGVDKQATLESERLKDANLKLDEIDKSVEENYLLVQKEKLAEESARQEKDLLLESLSKTASTLSIYENDISHFEESVKEIENSEKEAREGIVLLQDMKLALEKECEDTRLQILQNEEEIEEKSRMASENRTSLSENEKELELLREKLDAVQKEKNENDLMQKEGESYNVIRQERLDAVKKEKETAESSFDNAKKEKKKIENELFDLDEELTKKSAILSTHKDEVDKLDAELKEQNELKQQARLKLLEINQRRETLQRMERLLDGFSGSVKAVMTASESKTLSGIHGPVSSLISTDNEYITAIETCLGGAMQNIVVDDEKSAKSAIEYLKRTKQGRATFLPLTTVMGNETDTSSISSMKGFISLASKLIRCDAKYNNIIKNLLGRTVVATDIDSATDIARKMNFKIRIITLDGQLINAGGSFTGGQSLKNSAILTRRADIEKLDEEKVKFEKTLSLHNAEISKIEAKRVELENSFLELEREVELLEKREVELERQSDVLDERLVSLKARLDEISAEYSKIYHTSEVTVENLATIIENGKKLTLALEERRNCVKACEERAEELKLGIFSLMEEVTTLNEKKAEKEVSLASLKEKIVSNESQKRALELSIEDGKSRISEQFTRRDKARELISDTKLEKIEIEEKIAEKDAEIKEHSVAASKLEAASMSIRVTQKQLTEDKEKALRLYTQFQARGEELEKEKNSILQRLLEDYEMDFDTALIFASSAKSNHTLSREEKEARLGVLRAEMKKLGSVNLDSIEEYRETKDRYDFLKAQFDDTESAKKSLEKLISTLEGTMRDTFSKALVLIQKAFKETFVELFGGGTAEIVVTGEDVLECTIDINVQPPGKIIKSLSLLSGGEQSIVAIALYLAILKVSPSPFCIFDEIEAALDEANVNRFGEYLKRYSMSTQFIVITHRRGTMESADMLYGITMQEKGVSDYIRVSLDEYQGEIT